MGAACCVAVKEKTITNASNSDILHRNVRCSPTWSFRWDHRGRVAGEETSMSWFSDGVSRNDGSETKFESAYVSEEGSPLEHFQRRTSQKSSLSEATAAHLRTPASGNSQNACCLNITIIVPFLSFLGVRNINLKVLFSVVLSHVLVLRCDEDSIFM